MTKKMSKEDYDTICNEIIEKKKKNGYFDEDEVNYMVLKFFDEKPRYIGKVVLIEEYDGVVHSQVYAARNFHRFFLEIDTVPFPVMVDRISGWDYKYISDLKVGDEFLLDRIDSEDEYHFRVSINDYPYYTEFIEYKLFGINK